MVGNYVSRFYTFAIGTVRKLQNELYLKSSLGVSSLESQLESSILAGMFKFSIPIFSNFS